MNKNTTPTHQATAARGLLLLGVLLAAHPCTMAAEAETEVMGRGKSQFEFKTAFTRDKAQDLREHSTPFLARVGLNETMELRIATEGRMRSTTAGTTTSGWSDVNLGLRVKTRDYNKETKSPATAWQFELGVPTGSSAFRAQSVSYALKYTSEWEPTEASSIAVMPGILRQRNSTDKWYNAPYLAITQTTNWTSRFKSVVELVGDQFSSQANGGNVTSYKLGGVYSLTDSSELETVYSHGLSSNAPKHNLELSLNLKY